MAAPFSPSERLLAEIPVEMLAAMAAQAERSADRVSCFLDVLGLKATPQEPLALPRDILLELAAALWLWDWERSGIDVHRGAGLPPAETAIEQALRSLGDPDRTGHGRELLSRVVWLHLWHFAW